MNKLAHSKNTLCTGNYRKHTHTKFEQISMMFSSITACSTLSLSHALLVCRKLDWFQSKGTVFVLSYGILIWLARSEWEVRLICILPYARTKIDLRSLTKTTKTTVSQEFVTLNPPQCPFSHQIRINSRVSRWSLPFGYVDQRLNLAPCLHWQQ